MSGEERDHPLSEMAMRAVTAVAVLVVAHFPHFHRAWETFVYVVILIKI